MIPSPSLPVEMEQRLHSELNRTENLIWSGQPIAKRLAIRDSIPYLVIGVPWTAFSVFFVIMTFSLTRHDISIGKSGSSYLLPLFGIPFVLLGVWALSSPYWMWREAQKTVYALTDERALILTPTGRGGVSVRSIPPEQLSPRTGTRNSDGSGSLFFSRLTVWRSRSGPDGGGSYEAQRVGFEHVANVREVEALIEMTYHGFTYRTRFN